MENHNQKRNTAKENRKNNKHFPYQKLKRRYNKMAEETETETEEKEEEKKEED